MIFCFINVIKDHQIVHVFYTLTIKSCKLETSHQIIKFMLIVIWWVWEFCIQIDSQQNISFEFIMNGKINAEILFPIERWHFKDI